MDVNDNGLFSWALAGVAAVIGALTSAVAFLFRKTEYDNAKAISEMKEINANAITELKASNHILSDKADKCEEDRGKLFTTCEVLKTRMAILDEKVSSIDSTGTKFSHNNTV